MEIKKWFFRLIKDMHQKLVENVTANVQEEKIRINKYKNIEVLIYIIYK